jgi:hypothetical protein
MRLILKLPLMVSLVSLPLFASEGPSILSQPGVEKSEVDVIGFSKIQERFKGPFIVGVDPDGTNVYKINSQAEFQRARKLTIEYGIPKFFSDMVDVGVFGKDGNVVPTLKPMNPFARIAAGLMPVSYGNILENLGRKYHDRFLIDASQHFLVAKNLPEADRDWNDPEKAKQGKASMSQRHRFLIPRDPWWSNFNVLTIGLAARSRDELRNSITYLKIMKETALAYVERERQLNDGDSSHAWSNRVGLYFHCFPFNSVQYLHLHIVDLNHLGPAFYYLSYKNLNIDHVIAELESELNSLRP